jgi:tetratricopeptide (TPR) repeat protein
MPLEATDLQHVRAAQGYLELGMFLEANAALDEIDSFCRTAPEVLAIRLEIYSGLKKWDLMRTVAKKLAEYDPKNVQWTISWAYATRRAESIEAAKEILMQALQHHPDEAMVHFNLGCYASQLGDLTLAKAHLKRAFVIEPECRLMALNDPDLEPLWAQLGNLGSEV